VCLKRLQLKKGAIPINIKHDNINICNENVVLPLGLTPNLNINKQIDFGNVLTVYRHLLNYVGLFI